MDAAQLRAPHEAPEEKSGPSRVGGRVRRDRPTLAALGRSHDPRHGSEASGDSPGGAREALVLWLATRAALTVAVLVGSLLLHVDDALRRSHPGRWALERFVWWDSWHFLRIAEKGYLPPGLPCCDQAFFPGYPLLSVRWRR